MIFLPNFSCGGRRCFIALGPSCLFFQPHSPSPGNSPPSLRSRLRPTGPPSRDGPPSSSLRTICSRASLTVTPVLRLASGKEIALDPTTIPPNASVSVWVNEGLLAHASDLLSQPGSYGSVVFRYTSPSAGNLYANVILSIHGEPISFPIVARPSWSIPGRTPSSLEGIWWQPRANLNDVLVISNNSDAKISGTLILSDASGKQWTQNTPLGPRQTLRFSTGEFISKAGLGGSYGGISFVPQSPSDGIDAVHFLYDEVSKFSAALELSSRYPQMSLQERAGPEAKHWTMRAPMLALQNPDPVTWPSARHRIATDAVYSEYDRQDHHCRSVADMARRLGKGAGQTAAIAAGPVRHPANSDRGHAVLVTNSGQNSAKRPLGNGHFDHRRLARRSGRICHQHRLQRTVQFSYPFRRRHRRTLYRWRVGLGRKPQCDRGHHQHRLQTDRMRCSRCITTTARRATNSSRPSRPGTRCG